MKLTLESTEEIQSYFKWLSAIHAPSPVPSSTSRRWTDDDTSKFKQLLVSNTSPATIAHTLSRSIGAIRSRAARLNLEYRNNRWHDINYL